MTSKHTIVTAMALVAALSTAMFAAETAAQKPAEKAATTENAATPRLTIVEPLKDFGTVAKGEKIDWTFAIKNTGASDLHILSAQPGCGCTVAEFDKVIKPGETGKVATHIDTTQFSGPISKYVTLQTDDPNTPSSQLTVHAVVKPYVDASPAGFARFQMLQGETQTATIKLFSEEEAPFEITKVEVPGDWVKVNYSKITDEAERVQTGRPGQNQFKVDITAGGKTAPIGPLAHKVKIYTNSKYQPEFQVSIIGVVRPTYSVNPTVLNFGEVAPGDTAAVRTVVLVSNDKKAPGDFKVTKVESSAPKAFAANVKPTDKPGEYEVEVKVGNGATGPIDGSLKIYTSDSINPIATIPVKGSVVKKASA